MKQVTMESVKQRISELTTTGIVSLREDFELACLRELVAVTEQRDAVVEENVVLKSNLMFWDAEDPEAPYEHPDEIASECEMCYGTEFTVQVAARMPNRVYRVVSSSEYSTETELVEGGEINTPATSAVIASLRAEGVEMFAESQKEYVRVNRSSLDAMTRAAYCGSAVDAERFARQLRESKGANQK